MILVSSFIVQNSFKSIQLSRGQELVIEERSVFLLLRAGVVSYHHRKRIANPWSILSLISQTRIREKTTVRIGISVFQPTCQRRRVPTRMTCLVRWVTATPGCPLDLPGKRLGNAFWFKPTERTIQLQSRSQQMLDCWAYRKGGQVFSLSLFGSSKSLF